MALLKFLVGLLLVGSIDIAFGIFFAHLVIKLHSHIGHPMFTYAWGVFFALVPDVDALAMKIIGGKIMVDHRDWPHWPVLIVPVFLVCACFSLPYAVLAGLCLLAHYVHDGLNIKENGEGIKWLAPFRHGSYLISWKKIKTWGIFIKLSRHRVKKIKGRKETIDNWLNRHYLRPTASSMAGGMFLIASIAVAMIW
jgi:hypothetical protein